MLITYIVTLLAVVTLPTGAAADSGQIQTITATHTYILGDRDSKDDARQRCLLEVKRKILEQAGVYIESASEVKDFAMTKDKIVSVAAAVMQIKETKEDVGFQQGNMTLTLTITATVDMAEARKLTTRRSGGGTPEDLADQKARLHRLESQIEAMGEQMHRAPGGTPDPLIGGILGSDVQGLRTLATRGDTLAQYVLARRYREGEGVPKDALKAVYWYEKAAAGGFEDAQLALGMLYLMGVMGDGIRRDEAKAVSWLEKAAMNDRYAPGFAASVLADLYALTSETLPKDQVKAAKWREIAVTHALAREPNLNFDELDEIYAKTQDTRIREAILSKKKADKGRAEELVKDLVDLGYRYANGNGVIKDHAKAAQWFEKAASRGDTMAQFALGLLYFDGRVIPQDYSKAAFWLEKAATQDDRGAREVRMAQVLLSLLYAKGRGVPQDVNHAGHWYNGANVKGLAGDAQQAIAYLYLNGSPVPQSSVYAYFWLTLSLNSKSEGVRRGVDDATLNIIKEQLTPSQLAEAQRLVDEWK